jgi:hypothetical protein
VDCDCNSNYAGDVGKRILVEGQFGQKCETLTKKIAKTKKGWGMAQMVECLPSNEKVFEFKP